MAWGALLLLLPTCPAVLLASGAGVFITRIQLREEDSAPYWCGSYNSSSNLIAMLRIINRLVSPASTTSPVWTSTWLLPSTVLITSPEGTTYSPSLNSSQLRSKLQQPRPQVL
ncbi:trem-like transcript 4 protein [Crocuta crocuta]